jgi:hypothetical protein
MASNLGFQNVKDYLKQKIKEVDPLIDTRDNNGLGDLLIKPITAILQPVADEIIRIANNQSLLNAASMNETELDELVANIFVTRKQGSKARGEVRIFFVDPVAITIPAASEFLTSEGVRFFSVSDVTITANQMSLNKDGDFYYVDTLLEAENVGLDGNIGPGGVVDFPGGTSTLARVENPATFTGGADKETNTALVERAAEAITVRDLVSKPAIKTVLLQEFDFIRDIRVIGYGDPEMERDFLIGDNLELGLFPPVDLLDSSPGLHIGGKVDIYIRSVTLTEESVRIDNLKQLVILRPKDAYDPVIDPFNMQYVSTVKRPLVDIVSIQPVDVVTGDPIGTPLIPTLDYDFVVDNKTVRFSNRERNRLVIYNGLLLGGSLVMTYRHSPDVVTVQGFMDSEDRRVVTADLLSKFSTPAFVDIGLVVTLGEASEVTAADLLALLITYINDLKVGSRLEVSDLVDLMYDNGCTFVQLPITLTVTVVNNDGTDTTTTTQNFLTIPATAGYLPRIVTVTEA